MKYFICYFNAAKYWQREKEQMKGIRIHEIIQLIILIEFVESAGVIFIYSCLGQVIGHVSERKIINGEYYAAMHYKQQSKQDPEGVLLCHTYINPIVTRTGKQKWFRA